MAVGLPVCEPCASTSYLDSTHIFCCIVLVFCVSNVLVFCSSFKLQPSNCKKKTTIEFALYSKQLCRNGSLSYNVRFPACTFGAPPWCPYMFMGHALSVCTYAFIVWCLSFASSVGPWARRLALRCLSSNCFGIVPMASDVLRCASSCPLYGDLIDLLPADIRNWACSKWVERVSATTIENLKRRMIDKHAM